MSFQHFGHSSSEGDVTPTSKRWGTLTKQIVIVSGLIAFVWAIFRLSAILPALIVAIMLAYILTPLVNGIQRRTRMPRWLILILVYIVILLAIGWLPALVLPNLISQFSSLQLDLQRVIALTEELASQPIYIFGYPIEIPDYYERIADTLQRMLTPVASSAINVVFGVASTFLWLVFILVVSFYLTKDAAKISRYLRSLIPPDYRSEVLELAAQIDRIWHAFFRGQLILGIVVGVTVAIVVSALGLRNGPILGLLAGVLEIIPNFGPTMAAVPAILLALVQGSTYLPVSNLWFAVIIAGVYILIQQIENNYLVPRIIGRSVKLHPVVVLVGALAGASIGGILGVLLAAPVLATLRILIKYAYRKVMDLEPFADTLKPISEGTFHRPGMIGGQEIEAVLFDLDGTLVDTDDELVEKAASKLQRIEPLLPSGDAKRSARRMIMAGERPANAVLSFLDRLGLDDEALALRDRLTKLKGEPSAERFRLIEGVEDLLKHLDSHFALGIVTTRSRAEVEAFLKQFDFQDRFQVVVSRDDVERLKPAAEPVLRAAELLHIPVERCAMVGDTKVDIEAANNAGAVAIGVLSGFGDREDLADADLILDNIAELRDWL